MPSTHGSVSRLLFLSGWITALFVITGRPEYETSSAHARQPIAVSDHEDAQPTEATHAVYREAQSTPPTCNSWNVSPMAMEAILDEMIRQGWSPPSQGDFLASISADGAIEAVSPDAALWIDTPRGNPLLDDELQTAPPQPESSIGGNISADTAISAAPAEAANENDDGNMTPDSSIGPASTPDGHGVASSIPPIP